MLNVATIVGSGVLLVAVLVLGGNYPRQVCLGCEEQQRSANSALKQLMLEGGCEIAQQQGTEVTYICREGSR